MAEKKFAVFDIDGTIVRTSLFLQIVDQLATDGHLPASAKVSLDAKLDIYKTRQHSGAFNDYTDEAVKLLFGYLPEVSIGDYHAAVDKVIARSWAHTYVYTRDLIKKLKGEGYFLIALSGSESYAVEQFTAHYGFDVAVGETYEQKNNAFAGRVQTIVHSKGQFLEELVEKHGLTYDGSYAVGDSQSDAQMLELTENPIAFNPEERLFKNAQENGWKIVVERKNVIYELEPKDGKYFLA